MREKIKSRKIGIIIVLIVSVAMIISITLVLINILSRKTIETGSITDKEDIIINEIDNENIELEEIVEDKGEESATEEINEEVSNTPKTNNNNTSNQTSSKSNTQNNTNNNNQNTIQSSQNQTSTTTPQQQEQAIWESYGMSEYDYYHKPMWSWARVDFPVETYGSLNAAHQACIDAGEALGYEILSFSCLNVNSTSGDYLGDMLSVKYPEE